MSKVEKHRAELSCQESIPSLSMNCFSQTRDYFENISDDEETSSLTLDLSSNGKKRRSSEPFEPQDIVHKINGSDYTNSIHTEPILIPTYQRRNLLTCTHSKSWQSRQCSPPIFSHAVSMSSNSMAEPSRDGHNHHLPAQDHCEDSGDNMIFSDEQNSEDNDISHSQQSVTNEMSTMQLHGDHSTNGSDNCDHMDADNFLTSMNVSSYSSNGMTSTSNADQKEEGGSINSKRKLPRTPAFPESLLKKLTKEEEKKKNNRRYAQESRRRKNDKLKELELDNKHKQSQIEIYKKALTVCCKRLLRGKEPKWTECELAWYPETASNRNEGPQKIKCLMPILDRTFMEDLGNTPYGAIVVGPQNGKSLSLREDQNPVHFETTAEPSDFHGTIDAYGDKSLRSSSRIEIDPSSQIVLSHSIVADSSSNGIDMSKVIKQISAPCPPNLYIPLPNKHISGPTVRQLNEKNVMPTSSEADHINIVPVGNLIDNEWQNLTPSIGIQK